MTDVKLDYISVGGNRHPAAADWDRKSGVLAFGADNNIALWNPLDPNHKGVHALLKGHTDAINAVRFFSPACLDESLIISGSVDKSIRIWRNIKSDPASWTSTAKIEGHTSSINCIEGLSSHDIFVTGAADATVRIWRISRSEIDPGGLDVTLLHNIALTPKFFPLAVAIASLSASSNGPSGELILAIAGTRASIQVYVAKGAETAANPFTLVATLTGHEAWIRSLAITCETPDGASSDLIIASASQDKYIRLWRIHRGQDLPSSSRALNDPTLGILAKASLSNKAHRFATATQQFSVTFEALLLGHEDWIYTTSWHRCNDRLQLLSASADNSLAVWEADKATGIWMCVARLGEISAQKGSTSATGSTGGFWLGLWSPDAGAVASLGRTGGWRLWQRDAVPDSDRWIQKPAATGHTREVNSIAWSNDGSYLLSTGNDQTTRLHAEWKVDSSTSWHEFSRPQIHGYDLNCIDTITNTQFISGADEKLLRVFDEPDGVADILNKLCGIEKPKDAVLPDAANIPVLGLSNKAIEAINDEEVPVVNGEDRDAPDSASIVHKSTLKLDEPPLEDHLARHMLWPELEKLYGHGYEVNVVAASHDGRFVATACRASSIDHAVIRLYDTKEWREVKPVLKAHALTVTGLQFSADDAYLLSVGRDRQYCVWKRSTETPSEYTLAYNEAKAHSRMILAASWAPGTAGRVFATGGRDKVIKIWKLTDEGVGCLQSITTEVPITALAFLPELVGGRSQLTYGLETGQLIICSIATTDDFAVGTYDKDAILQQSNAVTQLAWRPKQRGEDKAAVNGHGPERWQLAIASADSSIHIASIELDGRNSQKPDL